MKPLELVIFPAAPPEPHDPWEGTGAEDMGHFDWRLDREEENRLIQSKRFTDAELAAEYWALYSEYVREASNVLHCQERYMEAAGKSFKEEDRKCRVLHRFATLPHYDEAES